jgi:lysophospholipase L1-like esterase
MRRATVLLLASFLVLVPSGTASAAGGSSGDHAKLYQVSVGDSLASSVQPIGDPGDLYRTTDGYVEQLLARAQVRWPKLSLEKLGCPGETTTTMIHGGICTYSHGSQLDEAVSFVRAHRSLVAFITIDIGANDFPCQAAECIPAGVAAIQSNLPSILSALREAAGPDIPIIGMTIYNPFLANWLTGPDGQAIAQASATQLMGPVNGLLRALFLGSGASVADVEGAFASNDFATLVDLPGFGPAPLNVARICLWTWVCAPAPYGPDNHANHDGYAAIAGAYAEVLGL